MHAFKILLGCLTLLVGSASPLHAHDPGLSTLHARLDGTVLEVELSLAGADLRAASGGGALLLVLAGEDRISPSSSRRDPGSDGHDVLKLRYLLPAGRPLAIEFAGFGALPFGHKQYARVRDARGILLASRILSAESPRLILGSP